ncbi:MAG: ABC transporter permease [Spirochaetota bacterium]
MFTKIKITKNLILFIILMAVTGIISLFLPNKFLTLINFQSMASQIPEFGILAIAMMLAMITGGIDLSVVSITNFTGVISALILVYHTTAAAAGIPVGVIILLAILAAILTSAICGFLNGLIITLAGVPPILATLGTQGLFLGLAIIITKGYSILGFPEEFLFIGSGTLFFLPIPFILFILVALLIALLLRKSVQGFRMYMLGSNPIVARFSGVNNTLVLLKTYIMTGLLAGISSIIMISRVNSMRPGYGYAYLLQAILVAILGGTDPRGGFGNVPGVVMGIIILQVLQSGLNILAFSPFFKKFIWGMMLLLIMVLNYLLSKYGHKRKPVRVTD